MVKRASYKSKITPNFRITYPQWRGTTIYSFFDNIVGVSFKISAYVIYNRVIDYNVDVLDAEYINPVNRW